jgi:hypothetical protein
MILKVLRATINWIASPSAGNNIHKRSSLPRNPIASTACLPSATSLPTTRTPPNLSNPTMQRFSGATGGAHGRHPCITCGTWVDCANTKCESCKVCSSKLLKTTFIDFKSCAGGGIRTQELATQRYEAPQVVHPTIRADILASEFGPSNLVCLFLGFLCITVRRNVCTSGAHFIDGDARVYGVAQYLRSLLRSFYQFVHTNCHSISTAYSIRDCFWFSSISRLVALGSGKRRLTIRKHDVSITTPVLAHHPQTYTTTQYSLGYGI